MITSPSLALVGLHFRGQPRQGGIDSPYETNESQFIRSRDQVVFRLMHIRSRNMRMFLGLEITLTNQAHYMML